MLLHKTYFSKDLFKKPMVILTFTALLTTIASEIKVVPFEGEAFRFGLGSITFFLLILIWPQVSIVRTGVVTGIVVVCSRFLRETILEKDLVSTSLSNHLPAFLFYFIFALGLQMIKIERYKTFPLRLGIFASLFEFIGNSVEQFVRQFLLLQGNLTYKEWVILSGVALIRSYFVVGLYASVTISQQKKRMQEMLQVGSQLYAETLYLQKSMNNIEKITADSYDLYRKLKKQDQQELSVQALHIAQEIHEVKKDSQRILSGLIKITAQKRKDYFFLSEIMNLVVIANEKYSEMLKKNIIFHLDISIDYQTDQQIPLLALLNNLIANGIEAIIEKGEITIQLFEDSAHTCFVIKDSGKGIPKEDIPIIFEPGYTTKFNDRGVAATGIGLSHVKEIIQILEGQIQIETPKLDTVFRISIPTKHLRK